MSNDPYRSPAEIIEDSQPKKEKRPRNPADYFWGAAYVLAWVFAFLIPGIPIRTKLTVMSLLHVIGLGILAIIATENYDRRMAKLEDARKKELRKIEAELETQKYKARANRPPSLDALAQSLNIDTETLKRGIRHAVNAK